MRTTLPYGAWPSPVTAEVLVDQVVALSNPGLDGETVYWTEGRPSEAGRQVVVASSATGAARDLLSPPFSARTTVHEYGGRCVVVADGLVFFSNFADQRLYRRDADGSCIALTPTPAQPRALRFADPVLTPDSRYLVTVRERHGVEGRPGAEGVVNDLVAVATDGSGVVELQAGHDFYAAPRLSADGRRLCWLSWDHPNMPWDGCELWVGEMDGVAVVAPHRVAGGSEESISQPRFSPDGRLYYLSDRSGFWNLYDESDTPIAPDERDYGGPDWVFGQSTYGFLTDGRIVAVRAGQTGEEIGLVEAGVFSPIPTDATVFAGVVVDASDRVVCCAGSSLLPLAVVRLTPADGTLEVLRRSRANEIDPGYLSVPRAIEFPTAGGLTAHGLYYPPTNRDVVGPPAERPPLIVQSHGGPTSQASTLFDPKIAFWTSRGFGLVDVDYGGSSGYGRAYRARLDGQWGITDVEDCLAAATYLAASDEVDPSRMVIRGQSAGGYTTLAALAFHSVFAAGASHYGVSDLESLARDTHKFESRYLDRLVGPYPGSAAVYAARSPIHHVEGFDRPMIFFQGLDDAVVPPAQAEILVEALRARRVPVAYLAFPGEQHGFRQAATIITVAGAELSFFGRVLGFTPSGPVTVVEIDNAEGLTRT